jgi:hypothetical protein
MFDAVRENNLIVIDPVDTMLDYTSLQPDIDSTKIKAAWSIAQDIDVTRVVGKKYVDIAKDPINDIEDGVKDLMIKALCYYTYHRCLTMFQGTLTDSGYMQDEGTADRNSAKSVANEVKSVGDEYMADLITYISDNFPKEENENEMKEKLQPRIRVFGGKEMRGSNTRWNEDPFVRRT